MNAIATRLMAGAALILTAFVILTGVALQTNVHHKSEEAQESRMRGLVFGLLGAIDVTSEGLIETARLPDPRLEQLDSGLSAAILDREGEPLWRSASGGMETPSITAQEVARWHFSEQSQADGSRWFVISFTVDWEPDEQNSYRLTYAAFEDASEYYAQQNRFDQKLWLTLFAVATLLLIMLWLVLRWAIRPIHRLSQQIDKLESGEIEHIGGNYPREIRPLAKGLNSLLQNERARQTRYRNALDDLAHSLKTPLAVVNTLLEKVDPKLRPEITEQTQRMASLVGYHLQRAAAAGAARLHGSIDIKPTLDRLCNMLKKLPGNDAVRIKYDLPDPAKLRMNEQDLMEVLGNLLENAMKYGGNRVTIRLTQDDIGQQLSVEDNGPGFGSEAPALLADRGARADTQKEGQGIGLSITSDIAKAYGGRLLLDESPDLGGARISLILPYVEANNSRR